MPSKNKKPSASTKQAPSVCVWRLRPPTAKSCSGGKTTTTALLFGGKFDEFNDRTTFSTGIDKSSNSCRSFASAPGDNDNLSSPVVENKPPRSLVLKLDNIFHVKPRHQRKIGRITAAKTSKSNSNNNNCADFSTTTAATTTRVKPALMGTIGCSSNMFNYRLAFAIGLMLCLCLEQASPVFGAPATNNADFMRRLRRFIGVPMGVQDPWCDDTKTNLTLDWNGGFDAYTCASPTKWSAQPGVTALLYEIPNFDPRRDQVHHICMTEPIAYSDSPPLRGPHRPNWPQYGEYLYVPPQRWLHNLEHGTVVFLYHPCAADEEVEKLRKLVQSCLYRHIITPYSRLSPERPLALVTWGAKLEMNTVDTSAVVAFMRAHAHKGEDLSKQGQYTLYLTRPAQVVSDIDDNNICPWATLHATPYYTNLFGPLAPMTQQIYTAPNQPYYNNYNYNTWWYRQKK